MHVSIVIPIINEAGMIQACMENLRALEGEFDVLFVDGGSTDGTLDIIGSSYPLISCAKGRAKQMNEGASHTSGDVLLFLHCDSLLPKDAIKQIRVVLEEGYSFGCFRIAFDTRSFWMKCCAFLSNMRVRWRRIAFGDQGIFMTRLLFESIGGFPELPIMEDYQLSLMLRGKVPLGQARGPLLTSGRRFEDGGVLRTIWLMQCLQHRFRRGDDIHLISRLYQDIR